MAITIIILDPKKTPFVDRPRRNSFSPAKKNPFTIVKLLILLTDTQGLRQGVDMDEVANCFSSQLQGWLEKKTADLDTFRGLKPGPFLDALTACDHNNGHG